MCMVEVILGGFDSTLASRLAISFFVKISTQNWEKWSSVCWANLHEAVTIIKLKRGHIVYQIQQKAQDFLTRIIRLASVYLVYYWKRIDNILWLMILTDTLSG